MPVGNEPAIMAFLALLRIGITIFCVVRAGHLDRSRFGWGLFGFFLPLLALIVILFMKPKQPREEQPLPPSGRPAPTPQTPTPPVRADSGSASSSDRTRLLRKDLKRSERLRIAEIMSQRSIPMSEMDELADIIYVSGVADAVQQSLRSVDQQEQRNAVSAIQEDASRLKAPSADFEMEEGSGVALDESAELEMVRRKLGLAPETPPELLRAAHSLVGRGSTPVREYLSGHDAFFYADAAHRALYDDDEETKAIAYANAGLEIGDRSEFSNLLSTRAEAKTGLGDFAGAIADYTEALSHLAESGEGDHLSFLSAKIIYRNRADVYEEVGDLAAAEADRKRVRELEAREEERKARQSRHS